MIHCGDSRGAHLNRNKNFKKKKNKKKNRRAIGQLQALLLARIFTRFQRFIRYSNKLSKCLNFS